MKTLLPNEIVVAQCCDQQKWLVGSRIPDTSTVLPPDPTIDHYYYLVVLLVGSESGHNIDESLSQHGDGTVTGTGVSLNAAFGKYALSPPDGYLDFGNKFDDFNLSPKQMSEFTIDAWIYLSTPPPRTNPVVICGKSFFGIQWAFLVEPGLVAGQGDELRFAYQPYESGFGGNGKFTNVVSVGAKIFPGRWYYAAMDKDRAKNIRLYVNGKMVGKATPNDASIDGTEYLDSLSVGQIGLFATNNWIGQIDELRITKGAARYHTDTHYPIPTRSWPRPPPPTP